MPSQASYSEAKLEANLEFRPSVWRPEMEAAAGRPQARSMICVSGQSSKLRAASDGAFKEMAGYIMAMVYQVCKACARSPLGPQMSPTTLGLIWGLCNNISVCGLCRIMRGLRALKSQK